MQCVARVHDVIHTHTHTHTHTSPIVCKVMACIYISSYFREHPANNCGAEASLFLKFRFSFFFGTPSMFSHIHHMNVNLIDSKDKGQGEVHTRTGHEGPEGEQKHSSTFSLTSALGVGWRSPCSSCSNPGKETYCTRG